MPTVSCFSARLGFEHQGSDMTARRCIFRGTACTVALLMSVSAAPPASATEIAPSTKVKTNGSATRAPATVWFAPNGGTPDLIALFSEAQRWAKARGQVDVVKFGPGQVETAKTPSANGFAAFQQV